MTTHCPLCCLFVRCLQRRVQESAVCWTSCPAVARTPSTCSLRLCSRLPSLTSLRDSRSRRVGIKVHVSTLTSIHPHMSTLTCVHPHMSTLTCVHPHMSTLTCVHPHMSTRTSIHPHMSTLICVHPHMSTVISIHPHICPPS